MADSMEFWGIEVKGKEPCEVNLDQGYIIHVSQITLGDMKKDKEPVTVHVKVGDKKLVMGILSQETPQLSCDLIFDDDFEISHSWKNGSIHLLGYQAEMASSDPGSGTESGSDEEEVPIPIAKENGQLAAKAPAAEPKAEEEDDSDKDDSSEDDESEADEADEADDSEMMGDSDDESNDESEDSEDEKPAIIADANKKRPNADTVTPKAKKAKIATPSKSDSKKGKGVVHPGTPHPKKDGNTPAGNKTDSKKGSPHQATPHPKKGGNTPAGDKTPKSAGSEVSCGSCSRTFKSEVALQSHSKAKHAAK